jgi:hypothetical protein
MSRIILICDKYPVYKNGVPTEETELLASYGVNEDTHAVCVLQNVHPQLLGATFDITLQEWVIGDKD